MGLSRSRQLLRIVSAICAILHVILRYKSLSECFRIKISVLVKKDQNVPMKKDSECHFTKNCFLKFLKMLEQRLILSYSNSKVGKGPNTM